MTIAGALADEMGMDAVIKAYNARKNYDGNGTVTFSGGLIGDDLIGRNDEKGVFVQESSRKNTQLVSIGEGTAITMMQWRADADDMAQRMGDLRSGDGTAGAWVRTFGGKSEAGHVDNKYYGIQAGVDALIGTGGTKLAARALWRRIRGRRAFLCDGRRRLCERHGRKLHRHADGLQHLALRKRRLHRRDGQVGQAPQ